MSPTCTNNYNTESTLPNPPENLSGKESQPVSDSGDQGQDNPQTKASQSLNGKGFSTVKRRKPSKKKPKKQSQRIWVGYDTEYNPQPDGSQHPVSTQIFIKDANPKIKVEHPLLLKAVPIYNTEEAYLGATYVFDSRRLAAGLEYAFHFSEALTACLSASKWDCKSELEVLCYTHYSNAELANFFPELENLRELLKEQGDGYEDGKPLRNNAQLIPIKKSFRLKNYHLGLPKGVQVTFADTMHLFPPTNLGKLGSSAKLPKLPHVDWEETNASQWLEKDPESFIKYAAVDASIPCMAAFYMNESKNKIVENLAEKGVIPPTNEKTTKKIINKVFTTASGYSEAFTLAHLEQEGLKEAYKESVKKLEENYLVPGLEKVKGGLNKYFISDKPNVFLHQDQWDMASAYASAMAVIEYPLTEPLQDYWRKKPVRADHVAKEINGHMTGFYRIEWELSEDADEWKRCVVAYGQHGGVTVRKSDENQWISSYELQALAQLNPEAKIIVHQSLYWKKTKKVVNLKEFISDLKEVRNHYRYELKDDNAQNTVKLIGNGTYGKLGQQTKSLDSRGIHASVFNGGKISQTAHGKITKSLITNPIYANLITGYIRSNIAITSSINKAVMCVTDSVLVETGKFRDPSNVKTKYNHLRKCLSGIKWELEKEDCDFAVFKERDYFGYKVKKEHSREEIAETIKKGEWDSSMPEKLIEKIIPVKIAKRGYKSKDKNESLDSQWRFIRDSIPRMKGKPMTFVSRDLLGAKDFLTGRGKLNSASETKRSIGSYNNRYMCDNLEEFHRRTLVKEQCRRKGYADEAHCVLENPELFEKIQKRCFPKAQLKHTVPPEIKRIIAGLHHFHKMSVRKLEKHTGISKSTISRWTCEMIAGGEVRLTQIKSEIGGNPLILKIEGQEFLIDENRDRCLAKLSRWKKSKNEDCPTSHFGAASPKRKVGQSNSQGSENSEAIVLQGF